jgi:hypothetical protein
VNRLQEETTEMSRTERLVERKVTYTLETGAQFFAPHTVERLRETVLRKGRPDKVVETPVYEYAEGRANS